MSKGELKLNLSIVLTIVGACVAAVASTVVYANAQYASQTQVQQNTSDISTLQTSQAKTDVEYQNIEAQIGPIYNYYLERGLISGNRVNLASTTIQAVNTQ